MPKTVPEDTVRNSGKGQRETSGCRRDLAILRDENRTLRTPATSQEIQVPRRAALTTTKVPRFDGTTSWEQYY